MKSLRERPLSGFKEVVIADTAVFGSLAATVCGLERYGAENVVFASDCPFDPEGGTHVHPPDHQYHRRARHLAGGP